MRLLPLLILPIACFSLSSAFSAGNVNQNITAQAPLASFANSSLIVVPDLKNIHEMDNPDHEYQVTVSDYCSFLNAVASESDPYGLYDERMESDSNAAYLMRNGDEGNYMYQPVPGCEGLPMTYINRFAAARYCNWLANGQPSGPESDDTTEDGLDTLQGATTVADLAKEVLGKYQYTLTGEGEPEYKDAETGLRLYILEPHVSTQQIVHKSTIRASKRVLTDAPSHHKGDHKKQKHPKNVLKAFVLGGIVSLIFFMPKLAGLL